MRAIIYRRGAHSTGLFMLNVSIDDTSANILFPRSPTWYYDNGYNTLVAPFVDDFNPGANSNSVVEYAGNAQKIIVRWRNVALWGSSWYGFTFSVELRSSGHIRIYHDTVG